MLLIWKGLGILVPLLAFVELMLVMAVPNSINPTLGLLLKFVIVLAGTFALWHLGRSLNNRPGKVLIDPETNEPVMLRAPRHDFFWIPIEYWAFIVAILCTAAAVIPASPKHP